MFKQLDLRVIGGMVIIAILLLAGTHFFSRWSYDRFVSDIREPPQSTTSSGPASENDIIKPSEQSKSALSPKSVNENLEIEPKPVVEPELIKTIEAKEMPAEMAKAVEPASEFDATSLLPAFGIPEEISSLLDEDAEAADFEKAQAHLTEKFGPSPEVEAIIDKLKQMSGRPVQLEEVTALFEAWIQVLPEEQHESRRQLMNVLTQINQVKALGGDGPVHISIQVQEPENVEE